MKMNIKAVIFILVVLAIGAVLVIPYLDTGVKGPEKFAVTTDPAGKLKQATSKGRPVFLEFYSAG